MHAIVKFSLFLPRARNSILRTEILDQSGLNDVTANSFNGTVKFVVGEKGERPMAVLVVCNWLSLASSF